MNKKEHIANTRILFGFPTVGKSKLLEEARKAGNARIIDTDEYVLSAAWDWTHLELFARPGNDKKRISLHKYMLTILTKTIPIFLGNGTCMITNFVDKPVLDAVDASKFFSTIYFARVSVKEIVEISNKRDAGHLTEEVVAPWVEGVLQSLGETFDYTFLFVNDDDADSYPNEGTLYMSDFVTYDQNNRVWMIGIPEKARADQYRFIDPKGKFHDVFLCYAKGSAISDGCIQRLGVHLEDATFVANLKAASE